MLRASQGTGCRDLTCQPIVIETNLKPTGTPNLGCGEQGNFIHYKRLGCEAAGLWNSSTALQFSYERARQWNRTAGRWPSGEEPLRPDGSAPLCPYLSHSDRDIFRLSPSAGETSSLFGGKGKCASQARREDDLCGEKSALSP